MEPEAADAKSQIGRRTGRAVNITSLFIQIQVIHQRDDSDDDSEKVSDDCSLGTCR
jgi:hypothetical protein